MQVNRGFRAGFTNRAEMIRTACNHSLVASCFISIYLYLFRALLTFACIYLFIGLLHRDNGTVHEPRSAQRTDGAARRSTAGVNKRGASHLIFASVPLTRASRREIKVKSICLDVGDLSLHQWPVSFEDITDS